MQRPPDDTQGRGNRKQRKERGAVGKSGEAGNDVVENRGNGEGVVGLETRRELNVFVYVTPLSQGFK